MLHEEVEIDNIVRCLQCGKVLDSGRVDKRFCSTRCKNLWHNRQRLPNRAKEIQRVLRILDRNREVLDKLLKLGIRGVDRPTLIHLGFNMNFFTSLQKVGRHQWVYSCLDIRYELTPTRIRNIAYLWEGVSSNGAGETAMPAASASGDL